MKLERVTLQFHEKDGPHCCNDLSVECRRTDPRHGEPEGQWIVSLSTHSGSFTVDPDSLDGVLESFSGIQKFMHGLQKMLVDTAIKSEASR